MTAVWGSQRRGRLDPCDGVAEGPRCQVENFHFLWWVTGIKGRFLSEGEPGAELCFPKTHPAGVWSRQSLGTGRSRLGACPTVLHVQLGPRAWPLLCPVLGTFPGAPNLLSGRNLAREYTASFVTAQNSLECAILSLPSRFVQAVWQHGPRTVVGLYGNDAGTLHLFCLSHLRQQKLFPVRI